MEKDGWRFVGPACCLVVVSAGLGWWTGNTIFIAGCALFAVMAGYLVFFFRDPERQAPAGDGWVVSPADGKVLGVETDADGRRRIAIFLSVFDVHVNRAPVTGTVDSVRYLPGRFFKAFDPRASKENEQVIVTVNSRYGLIEFALIAGILARRVVCRLKVGQQLQIGQRIGLIRFGSRAEVVLPAGISPMVQRGDRVKGGITPLARLEAGDSDA